MTGFGVIRLSIVRERRIAHRARHIAVIASAAKQSNNCCSQTGLLRRCAPRNDALKTCPQLTGVRFGSKDIAQFHWLAFSARLTGNTLYAGASSVTGDVITRNTRSTRPEFEMACSTPGGKKIKSCLRTTWLLPAISIIPSPSST